MTEVMEVEQRSLPFFSSLPGVVVMVASHFAGSGCGGDIFTEFPHLARSTAIGARLHIAMD